METPPVVFSDAEKNTLSSASPLTIVRIKRKRHEEPLDALFVQQTLDHVHNEKRIRKDADTGNKVDAPGTGLAGAPTMFRLAETVEEKSFSSITEAQKLKDRISRRLLPGSRPRTPDNADDRTDRMMQQHRDTGRQARYRIIQQNRSRASSSLPPIVQSASEKAVNDMFQMYEAVRDDQESKKPKLLLDDDIDDPDDIMCNFIPMVKEYLTLNEREEESDDDYVYDVYYRDDSNHSSGINASNIGSLVWFNDETEYLNDDSDSEPGDYADEDSNAEDYYQNDYPDEEDSDEAFEDQYGYDESSDDEDYY